jgi:hypothetical protein
MSEQNYGATTAVGRRVDALTNVLNNLSLEDGDKEIIEGHLREIKNETVKPPKIKDLITFDPARQKLRGWLTAADNFVYNQKIEGEENKVRVIGSYLREQAWDWFEPVLNEANNRSRTSWEERTSKIMGSYREFKKAIGKVFGDVNERQTAAEKIAKLRQTTSVTAYITEFQTISSSLDWDEEAKEDKFIDGLKQEIRQGLIYFTKDADDLDELFERTQKIDRELGRTKRETRTQRQPNIETGRSFYKGNRNFRRDGDGDVIMKGAKVDLEKAKKERLCFNCGKKGHQARFCRDKKNNNGKGRTVRMLRTSKVEPNKEPSGTKEDTLEESDNDSWASAIEDENKNWPVKENSPTTDEKNKRIQGWTLTTHDAITVDRRRSSRNNAGRGRTPQLRRKPRFTGKWPEDRESRPMATARSEAFRMKSESPKHETTTSDECLHYEEEEPREEDTGGLGSSGNYKFQELEPREKSWQDRVGFFDEKFNNRQRETNWEVETCNCYSFRVCWAFTNETWSEHVETCRNCGTWEERSCDVPGHDKVTKRLLLNDLSGRRHVPDTQLIKEKGGNAASWTKNDCCTDGLCTHEFITHANRKIPWWACFGDTCEDHMAQKINSQQLPQIPYVTIKNAQRCPCLRRGCRCNYDNNHPFHEALLSPPANVSVVDALKDTIRTLENHVINSNKREKELRERVHRIRQTTTKQEGQMTTEVRVGKSTITTVIDSGADINYVNKQWCEEMKIPYKMTGWGWIKSFRGEKTRTKVLEANIKIRVQGRFSRTKFSVLEETGEDKIVLGIPWLEEANPTIDWKRRTIKFHGKKNGKFRSPQIRIVDTREFEHAETPWIGYNERKKIVRTLPTIKEERASKDNDQTQELEGRIVNEAPGHSPAYEKEIQEIRKQLPDQVKDFADVFCSED